MAYQTYGPGELPHPKAKRKRTWGEIRVSIVKGLIFEAVVVTLGALTTFMIFMSGISLTDETVFGFRFAPWHALLFGAGYTLSVFAIHAVFASTKRRTPLAILTAVATGLLTGTVTMALPVIYLLGIVLYVIAIPTGFLNVPLGAMIWLTLIAAPALTGIETELL